MDISQLLTWYVLTALTWGCLMCLAIVDRYDDHIKQLQKHTPDLFTAKGDVKIGLLFIIILSSALFWPLSIWKLLKP
jgi:hypothetical protein